MGFHTTSTYNQVTSVVRTLDVTNGYDPDVCGASLVYPVVSYPFIKTSRIINSSKSSLDPYSFNPAYLISAEEQSYFDSIARVNRLGLMVVLHDINPRKILTDMTYNELKTILRAADIPHN